MMYGKCTCVCLSMLLGACALSQRAGAAEKTSSRVHVSSLRATVTRSYPRTGQIVVQDRSGFEFLLQLEEVEVTARSRRVSAADLQSGDVVVVRGKVEPF